MRRLFTAFIKKMGYVIAAMIIIVAILVSISHLLVPILNKHRPDFERWASNLLSMPVRISSVEVSWYQYQPVVDLNEVTLFSKKNPGPLLRVQKVRVFFSLPESIWQKKLVPSGVLISGSKLNLHESPKGEFSVQGLPTLGNDQGRPFKSESRIMDVIGWLSAQPRLILRNIDVRYTGPLGQKKSFTLFNLAIANDGNDHAFVGKAILHQDTPTAFHIALQWQGKEFDLSKIKATGYVYVSGLSLPQLLKGQAWQNLAITNGLISAKIWGTWEHGAFQKAQSTFQVYELRFTSLIDKATHELTRLSGNIGWKRADGHEIIAGDDILVDLPSHLWPVTRFYLDMVPGKEGKPLLLPASINVGYVDLNDLQSFLSALKQTIPASITKALASLKLSGNIQHADITFPVPFSNWKDIMFSAQFEKLSFSPWHGLPGMSHLSGSVDWREQNGEAIFDNGPHVIVDYRNVFSGPLVLDQLLGTIKVQFDSVHNKWVFKAPSLKVATGDLAANVKGTVTILPDFSPYVDLDADFHVQKAKRASTYLPMRWFDPVLVKWLEHAFLSGEISSGKAIVRGNLKDFPFDHGNGTFSILGKFKDVDLFYAANWPRLIQAQGRIQFLGRKMDIEVDRAQMKEVSLLGLHAFIPEIGGKGPSVLHVDTSNISVDLTDALRFVHSTPLEEGLGKHLAGMDLKGPAQLQFGLVVPLDLPEKTTVQGKIQLDQVRLSVPDWRLSLDKLAGQLRFTEKTIESNMLQGKLFNKPFRLSLATKEKALGLPIIEASIAANVEMTDLEKWLKVPLSQKAKGTADVAGTIDFASDAPVGIHLRSNLLGTEIQLPPPYGKARPEKKDLWIDISLGDQQPMRVYLAYNGLATVASLLDRKQGEFKLASANIHLGQGKAEWPTSSGLFLTGEFDHLDIADFGTYFSKTSDKLPLSGLPLRQVKVYAKLFLVGSQKFEQFHAQLVPRLDQWEAMIAGPDLAGKIIIPSSLQPENLIVAKFARLNLHSGLGLAQNGAQLPKTFPSILFNADVVHFNNMPIGRVMFKTSPFVHGLSIRTLQILSPYVDIKAAGNWTGNNVTHLEGTMTSAHVSELLNTLGLNIHNFISNNGKLSFKVNWKNAPYAPSLDELNGTASINLGPGRVLDVGEENSAKMDIGRMLSIFSLQTIPRRLSLDFSDLFQKGYSFDFVRGNFLLKNGNAYTNDLYFDGPVARVGIVGRIGIKNHDYDFSLNVSPHVTSSIPVAATLLSAWNPIVGLAALGVNTVISPGINKAVTYYYEVKGPWNNPSWKPISNASKQ